MTSKADFTAEEWEQIAEGPSGAGMAVAMAHRGGTIRETFSMAKAYTEARKQPGGSQLVDELVSSKPAVDRTRHRSYQELEEHALTTLRKAIEILEQKATPEEVDEYRSFVRALVERVAAAHEEDGEQVSEAEKAAIDEISRALG